MAEMGKCALCDLLATQGLLCSAHEQDRLVAASCARIMAGTGLTYSNAEAYSQANWIKAVTDG